MRDFDEKITEFDTYEDSIRAVYLRNLWYWKIGSTWEARTAERFPPLDSLLRTEWSPKFEQDMRSVSLYSDNGYPLFSKVWEEFVSKMKNLFIVGAFRYGMLEERKPNGVALRMCTDRIKLLKRVLQKESLTEEDRDYIVDVANLALIEYLYPSVKESFLFPCPFEFKVSSSLESSKWLMGVISNCVGSYEAGGDVRWLSTTSVFLMCLYGVVTDVGRGNSRLKKG